MFFRSGGGARRGDINSPVLVGGARVFGPRPRSYGFKLNKRVKDLARRSALTYKARKGEIRVIENFELQAPRTKDFIAINKALGFESSKPLFVFEEIARTTYLSARNIPSTRLMRADQLNTYAVLNNSVLVLTEQSVDLLNQQLKAKGE